jgi:hypothetical protein
VPSYALSKSSPLLRQTPVVNANSFDRRLVTPFTHENAIGFDARLPVGLGDFVERLGVHGILSAATAAAVAVQNAVAVDDARFLVVANSELGHATLCVGIGAKKISKIAVIQPTVPSDKQRLAGVEVLCRFKD